MTTINGRTPEEIKRGLECCFPKYESQHWITCNSECPFRNEGAYCRNVLYACIKRYIQQLERERNEAWDDLDTLSYANTELHSAYEAMKRERDAAVELYMVSAERVQTKVNTKYALSAVVGFHSNQMIKMITGNGVAWRW